MELRSKRAPRIDSEITVPGDKSISHRVAIIAALSNGVCHLRGFLPSEDCMHTVNAVRALGIQIDQPNPDELIVHGKKRILTAPTADVPVSFVAFDLLWLNGKSILRSPLHERRKLLRSLKLPPQFQVANVFAAHSAGEIDDIFRQARRRENEGLMIKDPDSAYSPGRRGMYWFKLKKELATLDVVVVAAELGHGKRNHVLSDYTFAVRDEESGELLPIGKAYSGLTDVEIAELTEHFKQNTLVDHGRYREVKPDIVLEIAFNSIQPSTRHASGLALRFPRIKAIRRDKTVDTIDTLTYARELAEQYSGATVENR